MLTYRCQHDQAPWYIWTTARQSLTSLSNSVCIQPAVTNFPCHVIVSAHTAAGRFLLLVRLSGTRRPMTFRIWSVLLTFTDSCWKRSCSRSISVSSALKVFKMMHYGGVVGNAFRLKQSYCMLGPVSTAMGDCLRAGKPSRCKACQLGRLSLLPSVGW